MSDSHNGEFLAIVRLQCICILRITTPSHANRGCVRTKDVCRQLIPETLRLSILIYASLRLSIPTYGGKIARHSQDPIVLLDGLSDLLDVFFGLVTTSDAPRASELFKIGAVHVVQLRLALKGTRLLSVLFFNKHWEECMNIHQLLTDLLRTLLVLADLSVDQKTHNLLAGNRVMKRVAIDVVVTDEIQRLHLQQKNLLTKQRPRVREHSTRSGFSCCGLPSKRSLHHLRCLPPTVQRGTRTTWKEKCCSSIPPLSFTGTGLWEKTSFPGINSAGDFSSFSVS